MHLILRTNTPPPEKQRWHLPDRRERGEWSDVFEIVANWFCTSNNFNKQYHLIIITEIGNIWLHGGEIRYLAPSSRSIASLIRKAYEKLVVAPGIIWEESTPGIYVSRIEDLALPRPHYQLILGDIGSSEVVSEGTFFTFDMEGSITLQLPGSRMSQGLVWALQENIVL